MVIEAGIFLKQWRTMRGVTQQVVAERSGLTKAYVSNIERGAKRYNQTNLEALARALECEPWQLIKGPPQTGFEDTSSSQESIEDFRYDDVRDRIETLLIKKGIKARPASEGAGLGQSYLRDFLSGKTQALDPKAVGKLARYFQVPPSYILYGHHNEAVEAELPPEIIEIWPRIPEADREKALSMLKIFTQEPGAKAE